MTSSGDVWDEFATQYPGVIKLSTDTLPEQMDLLKKGFANGLVGQQPTDMGAKSIDTLLALAEGRDVPEFIYTAMETIARVSYNTSFSPIGSSESAAAGDDAG